MTGTTRLKAAFEAGGGCALLGAIFVIAVVGAPPAEAQTFTVLNSFTGTDGEYAVGVIRDLAGDLYGTTSFGGVAAYCPNSFGCGVVFKLSKTGQETVLYNFCSLPGCADGSTPNAGLIQDLVGNLYGTDESAVFKLDTAGTFTVLHSFTGGADGGFPYGSVIRDVAGNLYGTTFQGGASSHGEVFKLDSAGTLDVLYSFTGGADGGNPTASLIRDSSGNLYGTAGYGGTTTGTTECPEGCGVVFKLSEAGEETVLHSFTGGADGANPFPVWRSSRLLPHSIGLRGGVQSVSRRIAYRAVQLLLPKRVRGWDVP